MTPVRAKRIVQSYTPLQSATILAQLFDKTVGRGPLRDTLRVLLYTGRGWSGGRLSRTIGDLATTRSSFALMSTNFDDYLERELQSACEEVGMKFERILADEIKRKGSRRSQRRDVLLDNTATCTYLHGYIPDLTRPKPERGAADRLPVLSEDEYLGKAAETTRRLRRAFQDADILIVGSSVTDPPLLEALWRTRETDRHRFAIMPLQQWTYESDSERDEIVDEVRNRLSMFNVEPVFPDFYFQIAQFLRECVVCHNNGPGSYIARRSNIRYGARLNRPGFPRDSVVCDGTASHAAL